MDALGFSIGRSSC